MQYDLHKRLYHTSVQNLKFSKCIYIFGTLLLNAKHYCCNLSQSHSSTPPPPIKKNPKTNKKIGKAIKANPREMGTVALVSSHWQTFFVFLS